MFEQFRVRSNLGESTFHDIHYATEWYNQQKQRPEVQYVVLEEITYTKKAEWNRPDR